MESQDKGLGTVQALRSDEETKQRLVWSQFREADSPEQFQASWLEIQCTTIEGVRAGILLTRNRRTGGFGPAARWPGDRRPAAHMRAAAEKIAQGGRALALQLDPKGAGGEAHTILGQPVEADGEIAAVVVLDIEPRPDGEIERALRQLTWGSAWLELRAGAAGPTNEAVVALLEIVATAIEHDRFQAAATAFVTELATRFECERVALGHFERGHAKLLALSHSSQFDKRADLTRRIEAAMDEALDHGAEVLWPQPAGALPSAAGAHEEMSRTHDGSAICSILISREARFCGVVTLERRGDRPFLDSELELIEPAVEMAGAILEIHRREDRWLPNKVLGAVRTTATDLVGPRHVALKLAAAGVVLLTLFLALVKGDFRVAADAALEARVLRAAVAPFDGYILEAPRRAGDRVAKGDLLALLDDRDLTLEHAGYVSQLEQYVKQYRQALAERNSSDVRIFAAKVDQARTQRDLAADKLSRTRIAAPFDGIVVTGDLSQQLGSPLKRGDVLFEVAPLDEYRPVVQVDERDIDEVEIGQQGQLLLAAFPDQPIGMTVEKITPVSSASEGRNRFRVEARLDETPEMLRPGMKGVAKIEVDRRRLIWIWTHELVDWLRLTLWNWMP